MIVVFLHQQQQQQNFIIDFIKCLLQNESEKRVVWLPPWEVFVDFDVELRDPEGTKSYWKIVKVLLPDEKEEKV